MNFPVEKETVVGEISSDQLPKQRISEISMADKSLAPGLLVYLGSQPG